MGTLNVLSLTSKYLLENRVRISFIFYAREVYPLCTRASLMQ